MNRGDVVKSNRPTAERGHKTGFYVLVSRPFVAKHPGIATVMGVPVYSSILGLPTEVPVGPESGVLHPSVAKCDFITLLDNSTLRRVGTLNADQLERLDQALIIALDLA